jgi:hypothetical protein
MVYFMREAKRMDDFPKKEASGKKRERARKKERESDRERERETHSLELRAHKNFFPLNSS